MPNKKNKQEDSEESDEEYASGNSDSDIDSEGNYIGENQIDATFEGRNPEDCDYHGIKALLRQLFLKAHINLNELTELIISHNYIGSVVKQATDDLNDEEMDEEDDEEGSGGVFGLTTIINLTDDKDKECVDQIRTLLTTLADENAETPAKSLVTKILNEEGNKVGLLINERIVNIPAAISVPLFQSLKSELDRAVKKNMPYQFTHLVWISKMYAESASELKSSECIWANSEEENLLKYSLTSFDVNVSNEMDNSQWEFDGVSMTPFRKVMIFDATKLPELMSDVEEHVLQLQAARN